MLLLGPGARLPQTPDSVVSLQSWGITVLRLCGLALPGGKKGRHCEQLYKRKKNLQWEKETGSAVFASLFPP